MLKPTATQIAATALFHKRMAEAYRLVNRPQDALSAEQAAEWLYKMHSQDRAAARSQELDQ